MAKHIILLLAMVAYLCSGLVRADRGSALSGKMNTLAGCIQAYVITHDRALPSTWNQVLDPESTFQLSTSGGGPIPDNYYLVPNAPVVHTLNDAHINDARLIVVGRTALSELDREGLGRWVVYQLGDGSMESEWFSEAKIQQVITEARIVVPSAPVEQVMNPRDYVFYDKAATDSLVTKNQEGGPAKTPKDDLATMIGSGVKLKEAISHSDVIFVGRMTSFGSVSLDYAGKYGYFDNKVKVSQLLRGPANQSINEVCFRTLDVLHQQVPLVGDDYIFLTKTVPGWRVLVKLLPATGANIAEVKKLISK